MSSIVGLLVRRRLDLTEPPDPSVVEPFDSDLASPVSYGSLGKRAFDVLGSLVLLLLFAPAILFLAALVALDGGKPFIGLRRVGQDGRHFRCWKVRTMVLDAEQRLAHILASDAEAAAEWTRDQKLANDPRVTWLGRSMRATSLDELPQLWNVLKGDMSLVGPRPVTDAEMVRYGEAASHYMSVRPGITGLWQVQGRNDVSYDERVRLDVSYVSHLGFMQDIRILVWTVGAVLKRTGR